MTEGGEGIPPKKGTLSRRKALLVMAATSATLKDTLQQKVAAPKPPVAKPAESKPATPPKAQEKIEEQSPPTPSVHIEQKDTAPPPEKKLTHYLSPEEVQLYFSTVKTDEEIDQACTMVDTKVASYLSEKGIEKQIEATRQQCKALPQICDMYGDTIDYRVQNLLPGIIFAESKGDASVGAKQLASGTKPSGDTIIGLAQMKMSTAEQALNSTPEDVRKRLIDNGFIKFRTDVKTGTQFPDLSHPETSLALSAAYLNRLLKLYPDPGIAVWAYHMGEGKNMVSVVEGYAVDKESTINDVGADEAQKKIDRILDMTQDYGTAVLIRGYSTNYMKLLNWFNANYQKIGFRDESMDKSNEYVTNVAAGAWLARNHV